MRRAARLLPYLAVLLVVLIAAAFLWKAGPFQRHLRTAIANELSRQVDRPVSIGDISLSLTGRVVLRDLVIRSRDGSALLRAPEARVKLGRPTAVLSLSSAPVTVKAVTLRRPEIALTRGADKKWNIEDLLERKPGAPRRFTGDIVVEKGKVSITDQAPGGLVTRVQGLDLTVRQSSSGRVTFSVRAESGDDAFDALEAKGRSDTKTHAIAASGKASNLDLGYAFARLPEIGAFSVGAGRADIRGEISGPGEGADKPGTKCRVQADVREGEISFPWLRRPIKGVTGRIRLIDDVVHLDDLTGSLTEAPVEAKGTITGLKDPVISLDISATGLRYQQLKALLPKLYVPLTLALPSPLRIIAEVRGAASDVRVEGRAEVRVIKFRIVPWRDVVATFSYTHGQLKVRGLRAHGSPRRLEADLDVAWGKGKPVTGEGSFGLVEVPMSVLAQMVGLEGAGLGGVAHLRASARFDGGASAVGNLIVEDASAWGLPLGRISADLELSGGALLIRRLRLDGPTARGELTGRVTLAGDYEVRGDMSTLDLSAIGRALGRPDLEGRFPATIRASGRIAAGRAAGRIQIGPGQVQGRALRSLVASFEVSPQRVHLSELEADLAGGSFQGALEVRGWREKGGRASLLGRLEFGGISPREWVPERYAGLLSVDRLDGRAAIGGTIADPRLEAELQVSSRGTGGAFLPAGTARVRYQVGSLLVDRIDIADPRTGLAISGSALPARLAIRARGEGVDLSSIASLIPRHGLAASGRARVDAELTGSWAAPRLEVTLAADSVSGDDDGLGIRVQGDISAKAWLEGPYARPRAGFEIGSESLRVNGMPLQQIAIKGRLEGRSLELDTLSLKQVESALSLSGMLDLRPSGSGPVDLTIRLRDVDLFRALWRLDQAGFSVYRLLPRRGVPRLMGGRLNDGKLNGEIEPIRITGTLAGPRVEVPLVLDTLAFDGGEIDRVEGRVVFLLKVEGFSQVSLRDLEVDLQATRGEAYASVRGHYPAVEEGPLTIAMGNVDLGLLAPWLRTVVDLSPAYLGGQATVNIDIGGRAGQPQVIGDISIDKLRLGPLQCENARAYPIRLEAGILRIEDLSFRSGPTKGQGQVYLPLTEWLGAPTADLRVTNARLAPLPGMTPLVFDADLHLRGRKVYLSQVVPGPGEAPVLGLRGSAGRGTFSAQGVVDLSYLFGAERDSSQIGLDATLDGLDLVVPGLVDGRLSGALEIRHDPATGEPVLATPTDPEERPLVLSNAVLGLPRAMPSIAEAVPLALPIGLRVRMVVGDNVRFRYGAAKRPTEIVVDPGVSYVALGGRLTRAGISVEAAAESHEGTLSFPNGALTLRRGTARVGLGWPGEFAGLVVPAVEAAESGEWLLKRPPEGWATQQDAPTPSRVWRVWVSAEADGRVGDYYVSLRPVGQVYPPVGNGEGAGGGERLELNAFSIPALDQAYILALLAGQVAAPTRGGTRGIADLLADPGAPSASGGEITGIIFPPLGGVIGMREFALDVAFRGPTRIRLGERLFQRVLVSYLTPLGSSAGSRTLRVTYEVAPRWSVGWSVDEVERVLWEVQSLFAF